MEKIFNFNQNKNNTDFICYLLGIKYLLNNKKDYENFISDLKSRILMTYRHNFSNLNNNFTSDIGWGCMIRSGQMMLAEVLLRYNLGRNWRLDIEKNKNHYSLAHKDILSMFLDQPNKECYFSIHKIVHLGLQYGKKPGDWYGPETISYVIRDIVNLNDSIKISVYVSTGSIFLKEDIFNFCNKINNGALDWDSKLFLIIPLRLGLRSINNIYFKSLFKFLELPQSVGFIGGKPRYSLYFVGYQNKDLIYLDPHNIQSTIEKSSYFPNMNELLSYHSLKKNTININNIDPSLALGFYISDADDFRSFNKNIEKIFNDCTPIFEIFSNKNDKKSYNEKYYDNFNLDNNDDTWEIL
jgi:cysteine protease ATG4